MADLNSTIVRGKLRVTEDINANGSITGSGSGLTNLNASNISSGTLSADRLATSGAKAGSYGPSDNIEPAYGAKFNVPYITVDDKGRVTAADTKTVTIPASDKRGIQDNLTSTSTTDSLSANQGRLLKSYIDSKSDSGHTHNYAGSSSAGGIANSAKELGMLFYKASERAGAEGYYKIATITHKTWSYCSFTMFTANSYSGAKFNTLFDVRCSDNADSLNGFAFNIIGGTDISNKLKYLETKSGENITKIEIFMQCSRYEHPKFYLVTSSTSNGLAINTTDWGDTPDKASSTAMTGSAANTIEAAALTVSVNAGSATKPIYFNNGIPTACNYTLEKSVPSNAVFTDTNTWRGIQDNLTSTSTTDSLSANQGRVLKGLVDSKVNSSDLVELTLTDNGNKRFLIGSGLANTWSDIGTNGKVYTQSGSLYATYFYGTSDRRLKENIKDLDLNCLDLVNNINLREFSWKADKEHKPTIGAVAQELRQVLPEKYVHEFIGGQETDDEYLSINDSKLVYLLIGAIQEQQKEIESLKAKIDGKIV